MADKTSNALVPENLAKLWRDGDRERAVIFLRKALTPNLTVAEWIQAFNFEPVKPHIHSISMEEIFRRSDRMQPAAPPVSSVAAVVRQRHRRPKHEMAQIKEKLLSLVSQEPGSINTVQLVSELGKMDFDNVTTIIVNNLMNELVADKKIVCVGGKPKAYRRASKPTQAAPMIIKKASEGARPS